jgi:hypothetical protein|tara:strand:+ start:207 stop:446 length:240 start_codon:yes stop_codon:yes gene_type:complete
MNLIEGMTTIVLNKNDLDRRQSQREMNFLIVMFIVKLLSIALVSQVLWPRIIPEIFENVKPNPGFLNLLGLSIIIGLLL